ncbi:MAG: hypothetical protein ACTSPB_08265 [Candidatus Thorarchaeota archaeon]
MIDRIDILEPGGARSGWNDSGYIIDRNAMLHDILEKLIDMGEGGDGGLSCVRSECRRSSELTTACSELGIDLRKNLRIIQEGRGEEWLLEQDRRHRCPNCKNLIVVSQELKICYWCGYKLRD